MHKLTRFTDDLTPIPNPPTLAARLALVFLETGILPPGWRTERIPRSNCDRVDSFYTSPDGLKFRSRPGVIRHLLGNPRQLALPYITAKFKMGREEQSEEALDRTAFVPETPPDSGDELDYLPQDDSGEILSGQQLDDRHALFFRPFLKVEDDTSAHFRLYNVDKDGLFQPGHRYKLLYIETTNTVHPHPTKVKYVFRDIGVRTRGSPSHKIVVPFHQVPDTLKLWGARCFNLSWLLDLE